MVPVLLGSIHIENKNTVCKFGMKTSGYYSHFWAIIISPLFFGVAHFHHMVERIRKGHDILSSFLISMFQVLIE